MCEGIGVGLLVLLVGGSWIYWGLKKKKRAYLTKRKNLPTKWWHTISTETI